MNPEISGADKPTWPWPDSLDAMVAAGDYHTVLLENEHVRVLRTRIPAGTDCARPYALLAERAAYCELE